MKKYLKPVLYAAIGGVLGYSYYYFVGCTGNCPLSSRWYITTIYGLIAGVLMALPNNNLERKTESDNKNRET